MKEKWPSILDFNLRSILNLPGDEVQKVFGSMSPVVHRLCSKILARAKRINLLMSWCKHRTNCFCGRETSVTDLAELAL